MFNDPSSVSSNRSSSSSPNFGAQKLDKDRSEVTDASVNQNPEGALDSLAQPMPTKILEMRAKRLAERLQEQQHWFRRGVRWTANALWNNPLSKLARAAVGWTVHALAAVASFCIKNAAYYGFKGIVRPILNRVWVGWVPAVTKFAYKATLSTAIDLAIGNSKNLDRNPITRGLKSVANLFYKACWDNPFVRTVRNGVGKFVGALWNNVISKVCMFAIKKSAWVFSKALFLCMEGFTPSLPMSAAKFIEKPWGRRLAQVGYYGAYATGIGLTVGWYLTGSLSFGMASLVGPILAPSMAAAANRLVMLAATKGKSEKPGFMPWFLSKINGPFYELAASKDAFDYKIVRDKETGEPTNLYLAPPPYETRQFLLKRLGFLHDSQSAVEGLVDLVLRQAHDLQSEQGEENPLSRNDLLSMADKLVAKYEGPEVASVFYPNGRFTIAANKEVKKILQELKPPGLQRQTSSGRRERYLNKLTETIEDQLSREVENRPENLKLSSDYAQDLRTRMYVENEASNPALSDRLIVRELKKSDFRPGPADLLITGGQILGGIVSGPATPITIAGHLIKATNKILLSKNEVERFGLADIREMKNEFDQSIESANTGDEVFHQIFRMSRVLLDKLESGTRPFASEVALALANSIIINAPYVAQQEMDALNKETDSQFITHDQLDKINEESDSLSDEQRRELIEKVEDLFAIFGNDIIQTDLPIDRADRKWFHYVPSALLHPKRVGKALLNSVAQIAGGDQEARNLLKGIRLYFEDGGVKVAAMGYDRARSWIDDLEKFFEIPKPNDLEQV